MTLDERLEESVVELVSELKKAEGRLKVLEGVDEVKEHEEVICSIYLAKVSQIYCKYFEIQKGSGAEYHAT